MKKIVLGNLIKSIIYGFIVLLLILTFSISATATSTYSGDTIIVNGTGNTLNTVFIDINNPGILSKTGNVYILTAKVVINSGASLAIDNVTLKFNEPSNNVYGINNIGKLNITNSILTSATTYSWYIINQINYGTYIASINIINSDLSLCGGDVKPCFKMQEYRVDNKPVVNMEWDNVTIHDTLGAPIIHCGNDGDSTSCDLPIWINISNSLFYNISGKVFDLTRANVRNSTFREVDISGVDEFLILSWGQNGSVYDSTFRNITGSTSSRVWYCKEDKGGCVFDNNTVSNESGAGGVIGIYGSQHSIPVIVANNTFTDIVCAGGGDCTFYWRSNQYDDGSGIYNNLTSKFYNNKIINATDTYGILTLHSGGMNTQIWNNTFINTSVHFGKHMVNLDYQSSLAGGGIYHPGNSSGSFFRDMEFIGGSALYPTIYLYDLNNPLYQEIQGYAPAFINVKYSFLGVAMPDDYFYDYKYADINVIDALGNPKQDAIVVISNITNNYIDDNHSSLYLPVINLYRKDQSISSTGMDGHTPLPIGNESNSIAILQGIKNSTTWKNMSYLISVFDPSHLYSSTPTLIFPNGTLQQLSPLATATVSPNESWYRPNPNTYQNTTVITIDKARTNISLKFPNGSITISNATRTSFEAVTDSPQSYVIINNTLPEIANQNLSFTADGVTYANSTADSKGFVSFNYTGTWSKHTFEWKFSLSIYDLNSDGEVNILDLNMIAQNFYQPAASCPVCDVDTNGIISILDLVIVAQHFGEKTG